MLLAPLKTILATVLPALKVKTLTLLLKVAVPPTLISWKFIDPLNAPDTVTSAPEILFPVFNVMVSFTLPAVIAPIVISPVPLVALVSIVKVPPEVTLPKLIASLELAMVPRSVTVPLVVSVTQPMKVKVSDPFPKLRVQVFRKVTALVKVLLPPVRDKSYRCVTLLKAVAVTLP